MKTINSIYVPYVMSIMKEFLQMDFLHRSSNSLSTDFDRSIKITVPKDNIPVIILIGGVQGSGKSAFINFCAFHMNGVHEESTIDCCKQLVKIMASMEGDPYNQIINNHVESKDDHYRTLLNRLKALWCEADDGPNNVTCNKINQILHDDKPTSIIFVNVREPQQIAHLKRRLVQMFDVPVLTLAVIRNDVSNSTNQGDSHTLDYTYDMYIKNSKDLEYLDTQAIYFCQSIAYTNCFMSVLYDTVI